MKGTSLIVQWLRLYAPNAGALGSIPDQGTRSHMLQLRSKISLGGGGGREVQERGDTQSNGNKSKNKQMGPN